MNLQAKMNQNIRVALSVGEIFDKITILEIKNKKITDKEKLVNIEKELLELNNIAKKNIDTDIIEEEIKELKIVNMELWKIEDDIRDKELLKEFDDHFIKLARSVYMVNDKRAKIKKIINIKTNSHLVEEKSYKEY